MTVKGAQYLFNVGLPNFYFHVTTAYGLLRHNGVEIGDARGETGPHLTLPLCTVGQVLGDPGDRRVDDGTMPWPGDGRAQRCQTRE